MNPLWYLATIPLIPAYFVLSKNISEAEHKERAILIFEIVTIYLPIILMCLSIFFYINNIIGFIDMILLIIILISSLGLTPIVIYTIFLPLLLIPIAIFLSYSSQK